MLCFPAGVDAVASVRAICWSATAAGLGAIETITDSYAGGLWFLAGCTLVSAIVIMATLAAPRPLPSAA